MSTNVSTALLWLFVINLGIALGAGLYEHRIVTSDWVSDDGSGGHWNAAAARHDNTGLRFWAYVTTGPLTLLVLANLAAAWTTQVRSAPGGSPRPVLYWWIES